MHVKCVHGADLQDCSYSNCTLALSILQAAFTASDGSQKNEIQPLYHHHFFEGFEFQNQLGIPTPLHNVYQSYHVYNPNYFWAHLGIIEIGRIW